MEDAVKAAETLLSETKEELQKVAEEVVKAEAWVVGIVHCGKFIKLKVTVLCVLSSVMDEMGFEVFANAQDKEFGMVVSEKDVLLLVPGNGQPQLFIVP